MTISLEGIKRVVGYLKMTAHENSGYLSTNFHDNAISIGLHQEGGHVSAHVFSCKEDIRKFANLLLEWAGPEE